VSTAGYDQESVDSIIDFASKIIGKSLAEVTDLPSAIENKKNKGDLGSLVEKYYFKINPPNSHDPDFPLANLKIDNEYGERTYKGMELKTTGVLEKNKDKFTAKERLVLTMINFESIVEEDWDTSAFKKKCQLMLILLYLFEKDVDVINRKFVLGPILYELEIPKEDLAQIRKDWETIKKTAADSKAHELSEGDTFYLKACRKGAGGPNEKLVKQYNSDIKAKSRAFSFNSTYLNRIIANFDAEKAKSSADVDLGVGPELTFAEATELKFKDYIGLTTDEISLKLNHPYKGKNHKGYRAELANRILTGTNKRPKELADAGIELKSIRLKKSGIPREAMSFQAFNFKEIVKEDWEDSAFFEKIESKFLLVIFKEDVDGVERLFKVSYWNMPYPDRLEAKRVWEQTKSLTSQSNTNFPKTGDSRVAHVRPKGKDGNSKSELPNGSFFLNQCFWLNIKYIKDIVESL
jgi:DNA mismatch repair protein MutH